MIIKPFIYALSLDSVEFNNAFLLDDGLVLTIIIFSGINQMFVYEVKMISLLDEFLIKIKIKNIQI